MGLLDFLTYGFIQRALVTGCFIAALCSTLGVFLVLRRLSLIGDGLAHVTFGGIALGLFLRVYPLYVAIPVVMGSSFGLLKLTERARIYGDAAIGIVSSLGVGLGILLASVAGGFNVDLFSYLFGNILAISDSEMVTSILLSVAVFITISCFYHELFSMTFDEESARAAGIKTDRINTILVLVTALTVVLAMRVVGIMLISSLLILPPVTALQMARSFKGTILIASIVSVLLVIAGVFISFVADLPTGATIILLNFLCFAAAFARKHLHT